MSSPSWPKLTPPTRPPEHVAIDATKFLPGLSTPTLAQRPRTTFSNSRPTFWIALWLYHAGKCEHDLLKPVGKNVAQHHWAALQRTFDTTCVTKLGSQTSNVRLKQCNMIPSRKPGLNVCLLPGAYASCLSSGQERPKDRLLISPMLLWLWRMTRI